MSIYSPPAAAADRPGVDAALLIARIALALPFIFHGAQIAFGAFGGPGLEGFTKSGQPMAVAVLVGYGEFLGGLGVLFGVLSRLASVGLLVIMLGAVFTVHLKNGYSVQAGGIEYALTLAFLALVIIVVGPARWMLGKYVLPKQEATGEPVPVLQ